MFDFLAVYFFMIFATILLICSFIWKVNWLCFFSAICWLFCGIYCVANYDPANIFVLYLGLFFIFMSLGMGIMPFTLFKKPKDALLTDKNDPTVWDKDEYE